MLENGKIYLVKTTSDNRWLFKKASTSTDAITSCTMCVCLNSNYRAVDAKLVCVDNDVVNVCLANENQIAMWNRVFNDNIEFV